MTDQQTVEIFSAGCSVCKETIERVNELACPSCDVQVLDMQNPEVAEKAKSYGVNTVPAVAVNGELVSCCENSGLTREALEEAEIGSSL